MRSCSVTPTGAEHYVENAGKTGDSVRNDAESGAFGAEKGPIDPNIQFIVERWDDLPEPVKAGILAMVRAS